MTWEPIYLHFRWKFISFLLQPGCKFFPVCHSSNLLTAHLASQITTNAAPPLSVNNQIHWKSKKELKKERKENKKIQRLERLKLTSEMKRKSTTEPQIDLIIKKEFQNPLQLQLNSSKFSSLANMVYKPINDTNASKSDAESEQLEKATNKFLKAALNSTNKGFGSFGQNGL